MEDNSKNHWQELIDELTKARPTLQTVHQLMKKVGLQPSTDILECMETSLKAIEQRNQPSLKREKSIYGPG